MSIETNRLILRPWAERDKPPFAEMSQDDTVMQFLLPLASRKLSDAWIERQIAHEAKHGFCFWAVEERSSGAFVGAIGLIQVSYEAHFTPAVEVGWRIARPFWGKGYAQEAAWASICFGFATLGLSEIVANAAADNENSRRVMEKLGMRHDWRLGRRRALATESMPIDREERWSAEETWRLLDNIDDALNGTICPISEEDRNLVGETTLHDVRRVIRNGDVLVAGMRQASFLDVSFATLRTETLSAIYELFLQLQDETGRKQEGAFYTPPFVAD